MDAIPVYEAADPIEAGIVAGLLAAHGIETVVLGTPLWGGIGELPVNVHPRIHLRHPADRPRALGLIRRYEARGGADWTCPGCGEPAADSFEQCWNCGTPRPA